jgi:PilZ domain
VEKAFDRVEKATGVAVDDRRQHLRIPGPFDGARVGFLQTPLQIFDLSLGGCFVNSMHEQQEGIVFTLRIDLPQEGAITLRAETLYRREGGYAVRFVEMSEITRKRLGRALDQHGQTGW